MFTCLPWPATHDAMMGSVTLSAWLCLPVLLLQAGDHHHARLGGLLAPMADEPLLMALGAAADA